MLQQPSRRTAIGVVGLVGLAGLAACTAPPPATPAATKGALEQAVQRTAAEALALRASALTMTSGGSAPVTAVARQVVAGHEQHLVALGVALPTATRSPSKSGSPSASGSPAPSPTPNGSAQQDDEWRAARSALRAGLDTEAGALAVLLVRIAAARATHADAVAAALRLDPPPNLVPDDAPPPSPSPTTTDPTTTDPTTTGPSSGPSESPSPSSGFASPTELALNRLLAGVHAAVYAYPVVIARSRGPRRAEATRRWLELRGSRGLIGDRLRAAGVEPEQARAGYALDPLPTDPDAALELAARVEAALAALAADVVANAPAASSTLAPSTARYGQDRAEAADRLVSAARWAARWSGRLEPLPGAPPRTSPSSSPPTSVPTPS